MGYWTTKSQNKYNVNLENDLIKAMQKEGARFCFMSDNVGIDDENNETFYKTEENDDEETNDDNETNDPCRVLREGITVVTENGERIKGYVTHWVQNYNNQTTGTDIQKWFIFQPGTYPTHYIIEKPDKNDVVITDL